MKIRELPRGEWGPALAVALKTFLAFEAPEYPPQGELSFRATMQDETYLSQLRMYAAFEGETLAGMLATRRGGTHIALLFVDAAWHRRGIARALLFAACADNAAGRMTVFASPYGLAAYHALGFTDTDTEKLENGMRFTPMLLDLTPDNVLALRKKSFAIPFDSAEIWCEHLDGLGRFSALVREKFTQDWAAVRRPSETGLLAVNLTDTVPTEAVRHDLCTKLLSGEKHLMHVVFVGLARQDAAAMRRNLGGAPFRLYFTDDFQRAKELAVHGR